MSSDIPESLEADYASRAAFQWQQLANAKRKMADDYREDPDTLFPSFALYLEARTLFQKAIGLWDLTLGIGRDAGGEKSRRVEVACTQRQDCVSGLNHCVELFHETIVELENRFRENPALGRLGAYEFERRARGEDTDWLVEQFKTDDVLSNSKTWGAEHSWTRKDSADLP